MTGAFFYVEYYDGTIKETEFKSQSGAKKAYKAYDKNPESNAKGYGWDTKYDKPTLSQQIRARKMNETV